jgi:hypothetical protein
MWNRVTSTGGTAVAQALRPRASRAGKAIFFIIDGFGMDGTPGDDKLYTTPGR